MIISDLTHSLADNRNLTSVILRAAIIKGDWGKFPSPH
ncbi:hypothetical protein DOT_5535 [Desulfosporosinus sp. OT]|nr:hypothetical protein DOT_5535 [Desulfosporosinus sp. OT]